MPKPPKKFDCPHEGCDASFKAESTLKLHIRNAHAMEDFEDFNKRVDICMKARIQESVEDMDYEEETKTEKKFEEPERFKCKECDSTFRYSFPPSICYLIAYLVPKRLSKTMWNIFIQKKKNQNLNVPNVENPSEWKPDLNYICQITSRKRKL